MTKKVQKVHVELLLGCRVRDADGTVIGRIESIRAERRGDHCFVEEYQLGAAAYLSRLGISTASLVGWPLARQPLRVPWDQLDLSDPQQPRLRCTLQQLKAMTR
jgi:hypothetical protein